MILVLLLVPVGFSLWFLIFVLFRDSLRRQFVSGVRARKIEGPRAADDDADPASRSGWTALDDQQLARFLRGSAP